MFEGQGVSYYGKISVDTNLDHEGWYQPSLEQIGHMGEQGAFPSMDIQVEVAQGDKEFQLARNYSGFGPS